MSEKEVVSIVDVIDKILEVIPETEVDLRNSLKNYGQGLWNIAPELLGNKEYFVRVSSILNSFILTLDEPWKMTVKKIYDGGLTDE